jgi:molybdenum cofactor cytidylyltransferase
MPAVRISAVVPAAGTSSRFGSMKLLADVSGRRLIERTLDSVLDAGVDLVVLVVGDRDAFDGLAQAGDPRVAIVTNETPSRGMFSSIQAGIAAADGDVLLVLPGDMPFVPPAVVRSVASACLETGEAVVPTFKGQRGHPIAIPGRYREGLLKVDTESSLKDALARVTGRRPGEFEVDNPAVLKDVDVPADLEHRKDRDDRGQI